MINVMGILLVFIEFSGGDDFCFRDCCLIVHAHPFFWFAKCRRAQASVVPYRGPNDRKSPRPQTAPAASPER